MAAIQENLIKGAREAISGLKSRRFVLRMDYPTIFFGTIIVFLGVVFVVVGMPALTFHVDPSPDARPLTAQEEHGRSIYASNGCWYCHSQYIRPQDWTGVKSFETLGRVAQAGDFAYQKTMLLGSERTGPDLSQEGGAHPDDWHIAHFQNPRYTSMKSIMPQFSFFTPDELNNTIAYVQSLGGKPGVARAQKQRDVKSALLSVRAQGEPTRTLQIESMFNPTWANVTNPVPASPRSLQHGKYVFVTNCISCHGVTGDGKGPAARYLQPQPFNFTSAQQQSILSDGQMYHAILLGQEGTAMPAWGDILTVNDIWDLTNFLRTIPGGSLSGAEPTYEMWKATEDAVAKNPQDPTKNPFQKQFGKVNEGSYYNGNDIGPGLGGNTIDPNNTTAPGTIDKGEYPSNNGSSPQNQPTPTP
jgi:cytochrome c oxidase cbb3-type subunit II